MENTTGFKRASEAPIVRTWAMYTLLAGFLSIAFVLMLEVPTFPSSNGAAVDAGQFAYPILLASVSAILLTHPHSVLKGLRPSRRLRLLSALAGVSYSVFFMFVSNLITIPTSSELAQLPPRWATQGFVATLVAYGPYAYWPILETWIPPLGVFVAVSIGTGLLLVFLSVMMYYSASLMVLNLRNRKGARGSGGGSFATAGSLVTACLTNGCGCCTSLVLPLVLGVFGISASSTLSAIVSGAPLLLDATVTIDLALILAGILLLSRRLEPLALPRLAGRSS